MNTSTIVAFGKWRKNIIVEITSGSIKTTYIGIARYRSEVDNSKDAYVDAADTAKAIWNIYRIIEDTTIAGTKITDISSPVDNDGNGTDKFDQVRDNYATLTYL